MHAEERILVTGATGNTGAAVLQQLEKRRAIIRAMVRSTKDAARLPARSATVVVGNVDDPHSLETALNGVTRRIWSRRRVRMPRRSRCGSLNWAAAGVARLVKLSQFAAAANRLSHTPRNFDAL